MLGRSAWRSWAAEKSRSCGKSFFSASMSMATAFRIPKRSCACAGSTHAQKARAVRKVGRSENTKTGNVSHPRRAIGFQVQGHSDCTDQHYPESSYEYERSFAIEPGGVELTLVG